MDLFISSQLLLLLVFCLFLFWNFKPSSQNKLPPGKTGWPIIGETLEFISWGQKGNPEKFVTQRMKKYSPDVFTTSLAGEKMVVFCGASGNKFIFSNENKLVVSWWPPAISKILTATIPSVEKSKALRSLIVEFLKPEALHKFISVMDRTTRQHFEAKWNGSTEVKAFAMSETLTFELACWLLFSINDPVQVQKLSHLFEKVKAGLLSLPLNFPGTAFNRGIKAANLIRKELSVVIKQRRSDKSETRKDLLSHVMISNGEGEKFFSEMDIADVVLNILIASHDTTSSAMGSVVYFLADHPHIYAKVLTEQMEIAKSKGAGELLSWEDIKRMKYSRNVINEAMRLVPPSQGGFKVVTSKFSYANFIIPKGWKIFWSVYSTHKDPKYFKNPEEFDPSRFEGDGPMPFTFIPFGGGPRMCPGSEFARLEVLIFMHHLVTNFRWEKVFPNEKIIYTPFPFPENGLPIRLSPCTL
uniref:Cytochrome P450 n=1 Tax=Panax notoginseng TaxID=44586 RepID=A0A059T4E0_9APIA|nr:cytochrome P450 [Panax notoginseng]